jgi:uncharacterized protein (UPF0333 family)
MNQPFVLLVSAITLIISLAIIFLAIRKIKRKVGLSHTNSSMVKLPYSEKAEEAIKIVINRAKFPIALDLAVEQIGKATDIYISTEKKYLKRLTKTLLKNGLGELDLQEDYLVFHHDGVYEILTGDMSKDQALNIKFGAIDFSKVNEIGEGSTIRMLFLPKKGVRASLLFSAPSQFQLREIVSTVVSSLQGVNLYVPKSREEAIAEFNSPDFLFKATK